MALSFQLGSWEKLRLCTQVPIPRTRTRLPAIDQKPHLSFDECVEIAFFPADDDEAFTGCHTMTLSSLAAWSTTDGKPWSGRKLSKAERPLRHSTWPFAQFRTSDAWHFPLLDGLRGQDATNGQENEDDPDVIPGPVGAPQFVHDLFERAEQHGAFSDLDGDGTMRIRTWYLHHQHEHYCEHPRMLEFEEDWRGWELDIGLAWRGHSCDSS